jgi:hypothetical protein
MMNRKQRRAEASATKSMPKAPPSPWRKWVMRIDASVEESDKVIVSVVDMLLDALYYKATQDGMDMSKPMGCIGDVAQHPVLKRSLRFTIMPEQEEIWVGYMPGTAEAELIDPSNPYWARIKESE